jgi:pimeloyl-ACP methyl ester carboxylesterase
VGDILIASIKYLVVVLAVGYLAVVILIWTLQDRLIFLPQPAGTETVSLPHGWRSDEVRFSTTDGFTLHASLIRPPGAPAPVIIYFGGNAEDVSNLAEFADRYGRFALLLPYYRGYGPSGGTPHESDLFADALLVYDGIVTRPDVQGNRVHLHGRSLGSGVAVFLATRRPVTSIVLTTPYDSLTNVAADIYPFLPISLLLRHKFDSLSRAAEINVPALFLVAEQDRVIPPKHSKQLYEAWGGPKTWKAYAGYDHNNVSDAPGYWDTIAAFLEPAE